MGTASKAGDAAWQFLGRAYNELETRKDATIYGSSAFNDIAAYHNMPTLKTIQVYAKTIITVDSIDPTWFKDEELSCIPTANWSTMQHFHKFCEVKAMLYTALWIALPNTHAGKVITKANAALVCKSLFVKCNKAPTEERAARVIKQTTDDEEYEGFQLPASLCVGRFAEFAGEGSFGLQRHAVPCIHSMEH